MSTKPMVTTKIIRETPDYFIEFIEGDIEGVPNGMQWDLPFKNTVFAKQDDWWTTYSIRTGYLGNVAYENAELAEKLNKLMDSAERRGKGFLLVIPRKSGEYKYSNVYAKNNSLLCVGERRYAPSNSDIPQYLPTPTF